MIHPTSSPPLEQSIPHPHLRIVRDEDDVPYDGQTKAERTARYEVGFMIVPAVWRTLPATVDIGDKRAPVRKGDMSGVYVELASYVGATNVVFPSVQRIADNTGYSPEHVRRVLIALEQCGVITKRRRDLGGMKQSNEYVLNHHKSPKNQITAERGTIPATTGLDHRSTVIGSPQSGEEEDQGEEDQGEGRESAAQPKPTKPRRKPETTLPGDFTLTPERLAYARDKGMSEQRTRVQFERFCNHAAQNERKCRDWMAAWRNWVLGDIERRGADVANDDPALSGASKAFRTGRRVF